jgi:hypothetical protein
MGHTPDPAGDKFFTALFTAILIIMLVCGTYTLYLTAGLWVLTKVIAGIGLFATLVWVIYGQLD